MRSWRAVWSAEAGTTDPEAPFGIVMLADSTDEGWGCNVQQMHWAQVGVKGLSVHYSRAEKTRARGVKKTRRREVVERSSRREKREERREKAAPARERRERESLGRFLLVAVYLTGFSFKLVLVHSA